MRIELTALAWEARVLPLYDARRGRHSMRSCVSVQSLCVSSHVFRMFLCALDDLNQLSDNRHHPESGLILQPV
jgi:hypothetical protein